MILPHCNYESKINKVESFFFSKVSRGKYNRKPDDTTIGVIKEWAEYEHLTTSKYAL